jgi:hypothetical protein
MKGERFPRYNPPVSRRARWYMTMSAIAFSLVCVVSLICLYTVYVEVW